jgi:hypothetical protein
MSRCKRRGSKHFGHRNRISDLARHRSENGFEQDPAAPVVVAERRKLERAEQELARLTTLKETRTVRWNAAAQFDQAVSDWILRGGIPHGCVIESVEGAPVSELMVKNDGGSIETAVQRCRLRLRELAADRHRVNSAQWPISVAEAAARELIERRADAGAPDLDAAIEHGLPISFATTRLTALVHNATPGAVTYIEAEDAVGLICWLFRKELLAKISAGFREIGDDKHALDQQQREEMLATISADSLAAERTECALIWHAEQRDGEIIDFRSDTTPAAVLGLALRTVPRAPNGSSPEHASSSLIGGSR